MLPRLPQDAGQKRSRQDKVETAAAEAAKQKQEEEQETQPNLDADITPEEMQMMQAMGIPFVSAFSSFCILVSRTAHQIPF
jgi:hypothetical protein